MVQERPATLKGHISPRDAMDYNGLEYYFYVGQSALECVRLAMLAARKTEVGSILDFACGHGRVLRTLKAEFPQARLTACDVDEDAIEFCRDNFDATPVLGRARPEEIELGGSFDLIWCGSLFTHLDAPRWKGFLDLLESRLNPGGLMAFSTHGRSHAEELRSRQWKFLTEEQVQQVLHGFDESGFGYCEFLRERKNPRLHDSLASDWGVAVATPAWVQRRLEEDMPGFRLVLHLEQAWPRDKPGAQDIVAVVGDGRRVVDT